MHYNYRKYIYMCIMYIYLLFTNDTFLEFVQISPIKNEKLSITFHYLLYIKCIYYYRF